VLDVPCYLPGYTLVEKLQAISTKYRQQQLEERLPPNFIRHYYDVYCLLRDPDTLVFVGTSDYKAHKNKRFRKEDNPRIDQNEAFLLSDPEIRKLYKKTYESRPALYYRPQPPFDLILDEIMEHSAKL